MAEGKGWRGRRRRFWAWFVTSVATVGSVVALAVGRFMGMI